MNPKLCKRLIPKEESTSMVRSSLVTSPFQTDREQKPPFFSKTSVRDQAALLLSVTEIARSELQRFPEHGLLMWDSDDKLSPMPYLPLAPRTEPMNNVMSAAFCIPTEFNRHEDLLPPANRFRSVSIDAHELHRQEQQEESFQRTTSPDLSLHLVSPKPKSNRVSPECGRALQSSRC